MHFAPFISDWTNGPDELTGQLRDRAASRS